MPTITISVLIANYNGKNSITACIESVLTQKCDAEFEIIAHDDASSDGSDELIAQKFPQVQLLRGQKNVGFCISNNRMAAAAKGQYLLLLNNDAMLRPGALSALLQASREAPKPTILTLPQYSADNGHLLDCGSTFDLFMNPVPRRELSSGSVGMGMGACLWVPIEVWRTVDGMPEWFGSLAEDMYLCVLARCLGFGMSAVPHSGYDHHVGQSFGGGKVVSNRLRTTFRRRALSERNKTFVMCITLPAMLLLPLLPIHIFTLLLEGIALSALRMDMRYMTRIYGPGVFSVMLNAKRLWRCRHRLKAEHRWAVVHQMSPWPYKLQVLLRHGLPKLR